MKETETNPDLLQKLPESILLSIATCSTDPEDLITLAEISVEFTKDQTGQPNGLKYTKDKLGRISASIHYHKLFEAVANNPYLPDTYKIGMVIMPGAQGRSEIVGDIRENETHIYEYLRRNSYIAGGHYAANMAEDSIRYSIGELSMEDMNGLRHLYYQRTFTRLANDLGIPVSINPKQLNIEQIEELRLLIEEKLKTCSPEMTATLWGWNFGFDYAPTKYRLHASHQQVHQQFAMLPSTVDGYSGNTEQVIDELPAYGCGDLIQKVISDYEEMYVRDFFTDYRSALFNNERMDGDKNNPSSLIIWQDQNVVLFVPKAQTSQWELQLMTIPSKNTSLPGNVVEADHATRESINKGILFAQKALYGLGAEMVTSIEYPKRLDNKDGVQPLIYCFLPRLPESPGAFSEAQLRYINGHYPEDFAVVCRASLEKQEML